MAWFRRSIPQPAHKAVTPPVRLLSDALGQNRNSGRQRNYTAFLETINTIPSVLAATSVIAYNFAASQLKVFDESGDEVEDLRDTIPGLYRLLKKPNKRMSGFELQELVALDYCLTGNAILAMDSFQAVDGTPTELYRLRPDWVRIVATADGEVYYGYTPGGMRTTVDPTWYSDEEILHARGANPLDDYWGLGVIEAGQATFETDRLINEYKRNYFDRGAILEGILTTDQILTEQQSTELRTQWRAQKEGGRNRFRTAVLGMGTSYQPIQEPMGSMKLDVISRMSKDDVFMLFGVPLQLAGDFSSGNYHNSQQALSFFYQNTMAPMWRRFEPMWDTLLSTFGGYHSGYDETHQDPDFLDRARAANYLAQTGAATVNQILEVAGIDPYPDDDPTGMERIATGANYNVVDAITGENTPLLAKPTPPPSPSTAGVPAGTKPVQLPAVAGKERSNGKR